MIKKSLKNKIWLSIVGSTLLVVILISVILGQFLSYFYTRQKKDELVGHAQEIAQLVLLENDLSTSTIYSYTGASAFVVNNNGKVVLSLGERPSAGRGRMGMGMGNSSMWPAPQHFSNLPSDLVSDTLEGQPTWRQKELDVGSTLIVGEPIVEGGNVLGAVFVASPFTPIDKAIGTMLKVVYGIGFAGILLSAAVALGLSRYISRPLIQLREATNELKRGNYDYKVNLASKDELGQLGDSFNSLATRLKVTISSLQQEKSNLNELLKQRREFLANVAHELRTPLSVIKGYAEAVEDNVVESKQEQQEYLGIISEEASRLHGLVGELLSNSRQMKSNVNIVAMILRVVRDLTAEAKEKMIEIHAQPQEGEIVVLAVKEHLYRVFLNLVENAVKYSSANTVVSIKATQTDSTVIVEIHNKGPVLGPAEQEKIFERFYRGEKSGNTGGTGLGLAISRDIIKNHDGSITVKSGELEGTIFTIKLPNNRL